MEDRLLKELRSEASDPSPTKLLVCLLAPPLPLVLPLPRPPLWGLPGLRVATQVDGSRWREARVTTHHSNSIDILPSISVALLQRSYVCYLKISEECDVSVFAVVARCELATKSSCAPSLTCTLCLQDRTGVIHILQQRRGK